MMLKNDVQSTYIVYALRSWNVGIRDRQNRICSSIFSDVTSSSLLRSISISGSHISLGSEDVLDKQYKL